MVARSTIKSFCQAVAREFKPQQIILFGSYAYGKPTEDSDVDLLVVMPFKGRPTNKSVEILSRVRAPFPLDLLVRTPQTITKRLGMDDWFMREIVEQGRVMYEARDA